MRDKRSLAKTAHQKLRHIPDVAHTLGGAARYAIGSSIALGLGSFRRRSAKCTQLEPQNFDRETIVIEQNYLLKVL